MRRTQPYDPLVEALESIMEAKRKRQYEQQFGQVSPILSRGGDRPTNIRDALAAIQAEERPTGLGGVLDRLNPFAPARGRGSEIEQLLLAEQMGREKPRQGILIMVDDKTLLIDPVTGETITEVPKPPESGRKILEAHINPKTMQPRKVYGGPPGSSTVTGTRGAGGELIPSPITEALETPRKEIRKRKRVEGKVKERPLKPKEYPDAKWSEEHQMWTIVKNGRLMGVK